MGYASLLFLLFMQTIYTETFQSPKEFLSIDIFEKQPIGFVVADIGQKLGLSVDKAALHSNTFFASNFKIVVASSRVNDFFDISKTTGRIVLTKHVDRDTLCEKDKLCCDKKSGGSLISSMGTATPPVTLPDGNIFHKTLDRCKLSFRVVYWLQNVVDSLTLLTNISDLSHKVSFCYVDINIHDLNDNAPKFLIKDLYSGQNAHRHAQFRPPTHLTQQFSLMIPENAEINSCYEIPMAFDEDSTPFSIYDYRIEDNSEIKSDSILDIFGIRIGGCHQDTSFDDGKRIDISNARPFLQLRQRLDRENINVYHFKLIVVDGINSNNVVSLEDISPPQGQKQNGQHTASLLINIQVGDINDHAPEVEQNIELKLSEDSPVGTHVAQIHAEDKDDGKNAQIRYSIQTHESRFPFGIDSHSGRISIIHPLDADNLPPESHGMMEFLILSVDSGQDLVFSSTTTVRVHIIDVNDEAPIIRAVDLASRSNPPRPAIKENLPPGALIAFITVADADAGANGMVTCHVDNPNFALESMSVLDGSQTKSDHTDKEMRLVTKLMLDREETAVQVVNIICQDHAQPANLAKTGHQRLLVTVLDENDNSPVFPRDVLEVTIYENNIPGEMLIKLNATDSDEDWMRMDSLQGHPGSLLYEIDKTGQMYFGLDATTGMLYTKQSFDREKQEMLEFIVTVKDHGTPQRSATASVIVHILDKNDNAPVFEQSEYSVTIPENIPIGTLFLQTIAHDKDDGINAKFTYHLEDLRGSAQRRFLLDPQTGNFTTRVELDRESESHYSFQVSAVDRGLPRQTSYCRVEVHVSDVNDNAPKFVYPTQNNHTINFSAWNSPGTPLVKLTAVDNDEGVNAEKIFLIAEGNEKDIFQLDLQSGDLSLKSGIDGGKVNGYYNLKLEARDNGSPSLSGFAYITVVLDFSTARIPAPPTPNDFQLALQSTTNSQANSREASSKSLAQDQPIMPYTDHRRPLNSESNRLKSDNTGGKWSGDGEGYFGSEHTLILIICLSSIATMLAFILFITIMWLRKRNHSVQQSRVRQLEDLQRQQNGDGCGEIMKRVLVDGSGKLSQYSENTLLQNIVSWGGDGSCQMTKGGDEMGINKRGSSPVYWVKTVSGKNVDPKNVQLNRHGELTGLKEYQALEFLEDQHHSIALGPAMFKDTSHGQQQANNCLYATALDGKLLQYARAGSTSVAASNLVMTYSSTEQKGTNGDMYLSIPSTSFENSNQVREHTNYTVDHPMASVYQSLVNQPSVDTPILQTNTINRHDPNRMLQTNNNIGNHNTSAFYRTLCHSVPISQISSSQNKSKSDQVGESMQFQVRRCNTIDKDIPGSPQYTLLAPTSTASTVCSPTTRKKKAAVEIDPISLPSMKRENLRDGKSNGEIVEEEECLLMLPREEEMASTTQFCKFSSSFV